MQLVLSNAEGPSEFDVNATAPVGMLGDPTVPRGSVTVATQRVVAPTGNDAGVQTTVVVVGSVVLTVSVCWPLLALKPVAPG